jgi:hypothetical protein
MELDTLLAIGLLAAGFAVYPSAGWVPAMSAVRRLRRGLM